MPILVKEGHGNEEYYFGFAAWMIVLFTAEMHGWNHSGDDRNNFDREDSKDLCETLKDALSEIEESICPMEDDDDCICNDCYFEQLVKMHQVELIDQFLWFCEGQPFRIDCDN